MLYGLSFGNMGEDPGGPGYFWIAVLGETLESDGGTTAKSIKQGCAGRKRNLAFPRPYGSVVS